MIDTSTATLSGDRLHRLFNRLWFDFHRPRKTLQLTFLQEIEAYLWVGEINRIDARIRDIKEFTFYRKYSPKVSSPELSIAEKLDLLGFDTRVVLAVQKGEKTGNLLEGIKVAINYLDMVLAMKSQSQTKITSGCVALSISLGLLIFLPRTVSETLSDLISSGLEISTGFTTNLLLFFGESNIPLLLALILLVMVIVATHFVCNDLKVSTPLHQYFATRRSLSLLSLWRMYRKSGIPLDTDHDALRKAVGDRVFEYMHPQLIDGVGLANVIEKDRHGFSPLLTSTVNSMSELTGEKFSDVSNQIIKLLFAEHKDQVRKLVLILSLISVSVAIMTICLLAFGMIFPIMSIQAGVRGL